MRGERLTVNPFDVRVLGRLQTISPSPDRYRAAPLPHHGP